MRPIKRRNIAIIFLLLALLWYGQAWATSATIEGGGGPGPFELIAYATFSSPGTGTLWVYHGSRKIGEASGEFSATWSDIVDGGILAQGQHTFTAVAKDSEGVEDTDTVAVYIDNTPTVGISVVAGAGQVDGSFDITGSASFIEALYAMDGLVRIYIDNHLHGYKQYDGGVAWSYSDITGDTLHASYFSQGKHLIYVEAEAANGANATEEREFEVTKVTIPENQGPGAGGCEIRTFAGNPINFATGNKYHVETDLTLEGPGLPMIYRRHYNSQGDFVGPSGYGWRGSFSDSITTTWGEVVLHEAGGADVHFAEDGDRYVSVTDFVRVIEPITGGYQLNEPDGRVLTFDNEGTLTQITDRNGNTQSLGYDSGRLSYVEDNYGRRLDFNYSVDSHLESLVTPVGQFTYSYDLQGNLISITNPDMTGKTYLYEDSNDPHNLTGIIDENGIRSTTITYDDQDRAVSSENADGTGVEVTYEENFVRQLNDSLERTADFKLYVSHGIGRVKRSSGSGCSNCPGSLESEYELSDRLWIESSTDANENTTLYTYDERGNILTKTEASGTPEERITTYTYHPDMNLITSITTDSVSNPGESSVTTFTYDANGNLIQKTETGFSGTNPISRTTTYSYNGLGQMTMIDGPRTDVNDATTFEYYPNDPSEGLNRGMLKKITDATGNETSFSQYNAFGKPEESTDANGVITTFTYDFTGRLTSRTRSGHTTSFDYDGVGNLTSTHLPGGRDITYTYTDGGLLERIEDNLGNYIKYSYDTEGNRIREEIHDDQDILKRFTDFEFDDSNRLKKTTYPGGDFEERTYDDNSNLTQIRDANAKTTLYGYDQYNRLTNVTQPGNLITGYNYDSHDNLITVTDANDNATSYTYDDLGRLISISSPDTGSTTYTYDPTGNIISKTDANGNTVTYTYDALNRLTGIHYPDSSQDITYTYDGGQNGKGRLTGMADPSGTYSFSYDPLGNLIREERTIDGLLLTTQYSYDPTGILTGIIYPDRRTVTYELDSVGRVSRVTTTKDASTQTLAEDIGYLPFGPITDLTYGNGTELTKTFDQRYQISGIAAGNIQGIDYTLDQVGNITGITDNLDPLKSQSFDYDDLYRLTGATGIYGTINYTYDGVGNRLSRTQDGQADTYIYGEGTNRLSEITGFNPQTFSYDGNGNITAIGMRDLSYNLNNRLIEVKEGSETIGSYTYNANGQRVKKVAEGETIYFVYDKDGNLIAEADDQGDLITEYVYLEGGLLSRFDCKAQEIRVRVATNKGRNLSGVNVYVFTESGTYTGKHAITDDEGVAIFLLGEFEDGNYKFRADYLSYQFWSPVITLPETTETEVLIEEETAEVTVTVAEESKEGIRVYLFNGGAAYLGLFKVTNGEGKVTFDLPVGLTFKFRADNLSYHYFSDPAVIASGGTNYVLIDTGGGTLTVTIQREANDPLTGIKLYLFSPSGAYLGLYDINDENGDASYVVSGGEYKLRADYLGYQFWTDVIGVYDNASFTLTIPHKEVTVTVNGDLNGDLEPRENLNLYLFMPSGAYLGLFEVTDSQGEVTFNLPGQSYKVRADYLNHKYWSEVFNCSDEIITINEGMADVTVTNIGLALQGVEVYTFGNGGSYLGIHDTTNSEGLVSSRLPEGEYNFRADYMANQYFSGVTYVIPDVSNPITISTGGGTFTLELLKGPGEPLESVNCYLFNDSGSYLGNHQVTSGQGGVTFNLADGTYEIRIDYLGYQFWTPTFEIPTTLSMTYTIPHQDVTIKVQGDDNGDLEPRENLNVYLFMPSGAYLGLSEITDSQGEVTFNLPQKNYKVRADYLNHKYWSEVFNWSDEIITIHEGVAEIHASQASNIISDGDVYVFSALDAYLNIHGETDGSGIVSFRLPEGSYKFRLDYQAGQFWAAESVEADITNVINLDTGGCTFILTVQKAQGVPLIGIPVYVFTSGGSYLGITAQSDDQGKVSFDLSDGWYKFRVDYLGYQFWCNDIEIPNTLSYLMTIDHQDVTVTVNEVRGYDIAPLENVRVYLFTESGSYRGIYRDTDSQGYGTFNLPGQNYKVRADYLGSQYWSGVFNWQDVEVDIDHGVVGLDVTYNDQDVEDAPIYLFTESGSYLGRYERTDQQGHAQFTIPAKAYKFRVDYDGTQYWSDVINVIAHEEISVELALEQLALDLTNDPRPVRFDGEPPKPQEIKVASLGLSGILSQSVIANTSSPRIYYYLNDHLDTPQVIIDENGEVVWSGDYEPFGAVDDTVSAIENNFRFPGQYYDRETGLYHNYRRIYNPETGTYLTPDPSHQVQPHENGIPYLVIGLLRFPQQLNLYTYVQNNPLNLIDIFGLSYLVFDRSDATITLYDNSGCVIGNWEAHNDVVSGASEWRNGTFNFSWRSPHPESGPNDPYGSNGNFIFEVDGRTGMGVHSGRANNGGASHPTHGCIRTTDEATGKIASTHASDPLTKITVQD